MVLDILAPTALPATSPAFPLHIPYASATLHFFPLSKYTRHFILLCICLRLCLNCSVSNTFSTWRISLSARLSSTLSVPAPQRKSIISLFISIAICPYLHLTVMSIICLSPHLDCKFRGHDIINFSVRGVGNVWVFTKSLKTVLHCGCTNLHFYQRYTRIPFPPHPYQWLLFLVFIIGGFLTSVRCYHCAFD